MDIWYDHLYKYQMRFFHTAWLFRKMWEIRRLAYEIWMIGWSFHTKVLVMWFMSSRYNNSTNNICDDMSQANIFDYMLLSQANILHYYHNAKKPIEYAFQQVHNCYRLISTKRKNHIIWNKITTHRYIFVCVYSTCSRRYNNARIWHEKFSQFVYKPHGHVHTGNLELIENVPLRNIMKMGAKFRETPPCNKNKLTYLYRDAIEQLTKK